MSCPKECGYRKQVFTRLGLPSGIFVCSHSSKIAGETACNDSKEFPINCPLKDSIIAPKTRMELLEIAKEQGLLFEVCAPGATLQVITIMDKKHKKIKNKDGK